MRLYKRYRTNKIYKNSEHSFRADHPKIAIKNKITNFETSTDCISHQTDPIYISVS
jgi:hypothetical protein